MTASDWQACVAGGNGPLLEPTFRRPAYRPPLLPKCSIASKFIQTDSKSDEVLEVLPRLEGDVAELAARRPVG